MFGALALAGCGGAAPAATDSPASTPTTPSGPRASASVTAEPSAAITPQPSSDPTASPAASHDARLDVLPSRIVVADLEIDLPVVSGDLDVPGNPPDYPLCDVAQYLTTYRYPARPGTTTWIYGHARADMFLPLLEASERDDGRELVGMTVDLYSDGGRRYTYRITEVVRHTTDRGIARDVPEDSRRLVLQTSEGPRGTVPKLQVAAELIDETSADPAEAMPPASPRSCYIP